MSELRRCELTGDFVVIAPARRGTGATRPGGLPAVDRARCPFCPGHEADTEPSVLELGSPWSVRVVANKFPITPTHEVVIESRDHDADLATASDADVALVVRALRDRARAIGAREDVACVIAFRNRGRRAGSSQPHPHTQILGFPVVPPDVARRAEIAARDPEVLERSIARERAHGGRVLGDRDGWITFCPFASRRAWEVRIAPTATCAHLADLDDARLVPLASHLGAALRRLRAVLGDPDYNVVFRDPPRGSHAGSLVIDLLPRTGGDAGFEIQSGVGVCVVDPDDAARQLRDADPEGASPSGA